MSISVTVLTVRAHDVRGAAYRRCPSRAIAPEPVLWRPPCSASASSRVGLLPHFPLRRPALPLT